MSKDYTELYAELCRDVSAMEDKSLNMIVDWPKPEHVVRVWEHCGLRCAIVRGPVSINGYVHVPVGHPYERRPCQDIDANVHGGLTFRTRVDDGSWFGFDTAHYGDYVEHAPELGGRHWSISDVGIETENLAEQFAAAPHSEGSDTP